MCLQREGGHGVIDFQQLSDGCLLFLPLCPSTNARMRPVLMGRRCRSILTPEARLYIRTASWEIRLLMRTEKIKPISDYCWIDLWFVLPRTNCDAHNYGKVLFDAMEAGGLVTNDKYILPRVMGVGHGSEPQVIVKIPHSNGKGKLSTL